VREVDGRHDVAVVEWIFVPDRLEDVFGRGVERVHEMLAEYLGERHNILDLLFLEGDRNLLVSWHCELLDHSKER
jgi:hypothetical protein